MISADGQPVEWALMVDDLREANEHLSNLLDGITQDPGYDESQYRVDLGHVMAHLNRAWARRNITRELTDDEWNAFRAFPQDLTPIA